MLESRVEIVLLVKYTSRLLESQDTVWIMPPVLTYNKRYKPAAARETVHTEPPYSSLGEICCKPHMRNEHLHVICIFLCKVTSPCR